MKYLKYFESSQVPKDVIDYCYDILLEAKDLGYNIFIEDANHGEMRTVFLNGELKDISENHQLIRIRIERTLEFGHIYSGNFFDTEEEEKTISDTLDRLNSYLTELGWTKHPKGDEYRIMANKLGVYYYK